MTAISLQLTARQWATIDAVMDNVSHNARDSFEDPEPAHAIREAGWQQVPWVGPDRQWPPMEQVITIVLRRYQWQLALDELAAADPISADLGDLDSLRLGRDAREAIIRQLRV